MKLWYTYSVSIYESLFQMGITLGYPGLCSMRSIWIPFPNGHYTRLPRAMLHEKEQFTFKTDLQLQMKRQKNGERTEKNPHLGSILHVLIRWSHNSFKIVLWRHACQEVSIRALLRHVSLASVLQHLWLQRLCRVRSILPENSMVIIVSLSFLFLFKSFFIISFLNLIYWGDIG